MHSYQTRIEKHKGAATAYVHSNGNNKLEQERKADWSIYNESRSSTILQNVTKVVNSHVW